MDVAVAGGFATTWAQEVVFWAAGADVAVAVVVVNAVVGEVADSSGARKLEDVRGWPADCCSCVAWGGIFSKKSIMPSMPDKSEAER